MLKIKEKKLHINIIFFYTGAQLCYSEETSGGSERVGGSSSLTTQAEHRLLFRANFFCADKKLGKERLGVCFIFFLSSVAKWNVTDMITTYHQAVFRYSFQASGIRIHKYFYTDPDPSSDKQKN